MADWSEQRIGELARSLGVGEVLAERSERPGLDLDERVERLRDWAAGRSRVTLVIPDATRQLPADVARRCLEALRSTRATVVVATGLHRPPNDEEWRATPHLAEVREAQVAVRDQGGLVDSVVVDRAGPIEVAFARDVVETDGIVACGVVELHQYAGFSGGVKAVAVGCASAETIGWIHRPALLRAPALGVGQIDGNPFRDQLAALIRHLPEIFEVQLSRAADGAWACFAGVAPAGWRAAVDAADAFWEVARRWPAAAVGVFGPKGANLYQASRGVTQLALQPAPPLEEGASILLVTEAPHGMGQGAGERAFVAALTRGQEALLSELAECDDDYRAGGGAQRAYILAMTSARYRVGYVSLAEAPSLTAFGWQFLRSEAAARDFLGTDDVLVVADPLHRLPRMGGRG